MTQRAAAVLCAPLVVEAAALRGARTPVVRTGAGPRRALASAPDLGERGRLVAGVAGGLDPRVRPGDVVVAASVHGVDNTRIATCLAAEPLAAALRERGLPVHIGPIVSAPRIVSGDARRVLARTGALAVDTESAWLAPPTDAPYAVVRAIVDTEAAPLVRAGTVSRGLAALAALRRAVPALDAWAAAIRPREVVLASPRSFCAGVERAIDVVGAALDRYGAPVYVRRQIVHNAHVVRELEQRGAVFVTEAADVPPGGVLVLAAHGVSPAVRTEASRRGLSVIDATCPLVTKVHTEVRRYASRGTTVFLIGHPDHEEVEGTLGEAPEDIIVVPDAAAAATVRVPDPQRVAYAMQTTLAVDEAESIAAVLRQRFPDLRGPRRDDICYATTNRQQAVRAIASEVDLVLVVGSPNSSNSLRLVEVARRAGVLARLVDDASEVDLDELAAAGRVGITAGASAPQHLVDDLISCLRGLGPVTLRQAEAPPEDVRFTLPKEVS